MSTYQVYLVAFTRNEDAERVKVAEIVVGEFDHYLVAESFIERSYYNQQVTRINAVLMQLFPGCEISVRRRLTERG